MTQTNCGHIKEMYKDGKCMWCGASSTEENNMQQFLKEEYSFYNNNYDSKDETWLKNHDTLLINFILSEVEREVENVHSKYFDGIASISEYQKGYLQAQIHISAMLNNLRVK